jgi:hypothetical protein
MCAAKEAEEGDKAGGKPSAKGGKEEGPQAEEEESDDDVRRQWINTVSVYFSIEKGGKWRAFDVSVPTHANG